LLNPHSAILIRYPAFRIPQFPHAPLRVAAKRVKRWDRRPLQVFVVSYRLTTDY